LNVNEFRPPPELCRNRCRDPKVVVDQAEWLIAHMCEHLDLDDLSHVDVLDMGCGVRFTEAFLNRGTPIQRYVGVDTASDVIAYLHAHVDDPRLSYVHIDAHNDLYNPTGAPLTELTIPELDGQQFDVICLFSVFTHLAPHDYVSVLRLLRRFVRPNGKLFFTLFINEETPGGHGLIDNFNRALRQSTDPVVHEEISRRVESTTEPAPGFRDLDPKRPLLYALYTRQHALELVEGTGWEVVEVAPPDLHLQHHIVATPT